MYGLGAYFSQANFVAKEWVGKFIYNSDYPMRNDIKLGFTIGFQNEFNSLVLTTYPRFLFQDLETGPQSIEYDRSLTKLEFKVIAPEDNKRLFFPFHHEINIGFKTNEFFITEYNTAPNKTTLGHYFGTYDLYVDFAIGKIQPVFDKVPLQFGILLGTRFHLQDFDNTNLFTFANGQGNFGLSTKSITTLDGKLFPSVKAMGFLFDVYFRQLFFDKLEVLEKIETEITGIDQSNDGFNVMLSIGYLF